MLLRQTRWKQKLQNLTHNMVYYYMHPVVNDGCY